MRYSSLRLKLLGAAIFPLLLSSCDPFGFRDNNAIINPPDPPEEVDGYAPIYGDKSKLKLIRSTDPKPIEDGGKIYIKGTTFYQVETGKGIHVLDITDAANPKKLYFIEVMGAQEVSIKNNSLYTNNLNDLVTIDISNPADVKEVDRIPEVFDLVDPSVPPGSGYYECVDPEKGDVVGWELKVLHYPKCRR